MDFNREYIKDQLIQWIRQWFLKNGPECQAVIGISGGKDSGVVAALCKKALGENRVLGVLMPNGQQADLDVARSLVEHLGIKAVTINIKSAVDGVQEGLLQAEMAISHQATINLPARIRMSTLYAVSQSVNGRVANTCNLSEDYVGYATRYGDGAGDFSPLSNLTVAEVKEIGRALGLPEKFVNKVPIDGLCGKTDEENLGFTYETLDRYIRLGVCEDLAVKQRIDEMYLKSRFKLELMPAFPYSPGKAEGVAK
jgi:NAD+ synthase